MQCATPAYDNWHFSCQICSAALRFVPEPRKKSFRTVHQMRVGLQRPPSLCFPGPCARKPVARSTSTEQFSAVFYALFQNVCEKGTWKWNLIQGLLICARPTAPLNSHSKARLRSGLGQSETHCHVLCRFRIIEHSQSYLAWIPESKRNPTDLQSIKARIWKEGFAECL